MNDRAPQNSIRVGPAGWSYEDWKGTVYPPERRIDHLRMISSWFDCIELNSSFYRVPSRQAVHSWALRTSENRNFKFTVKVLQSFTHERKADKKEASLFIRTFEPLIERNAVGAFLLQFPWSFTYTPENRQLVESLAECFSSVPVAIELRHGSWNNPAVYEFLSRIGLAFCNIDQPMIGPSMPPGAICTNPSLGYIRLHGRNYRDWARNDSSRDEKYNYLYRKEELEEWYERITRLASEVKDLYIITNNHFRGQALVNAFQIKHMLGQRVERIPSSLIHHYPVLGEIAEGQAKDNLLF